jgi:hypothetical protein
MQPDNEFVVVVDWAPLAEADSQFADWPTERGLSRDQVSDEDVRVDTCRASSEIYGAIGSDPARTGPTITSARHAGIAGNASTIASQQ